MITSKHSRKEKGLHNFLIPANTGLGNVILMTPFIRALRTLFPGGHIDLLSDSRCGTEHIFCDTGLVDRTLFLAGDAPFQEKARFFIRLRGYYDAVFFPFTVKMRDLAIGSILAGIPRRIGHTGTVPVLYNLFFTDKVPFRPGRHEVDLCFDLLEPLAPGSFERRYEQTMAKASRLSPMTEKQLDQYPQGKPFLALQIAAANGAATPKVWPKRHWHAIIARLLEEQCRLVILGDAPELPDAEEILRGLSGNILNLVGKTTVPEAALIISRSQGVICHDSGLMHVANALDIPLLALYGPTDFDKTRPLGRQSHVMRLDLDCIPCFAKKKWSEAEALEKCPSQGACMTKLEPSSVYDCAKKIFSL